MNKIRFLEDVVQERKLIFKKGSMGQVAGPYFNGLFRVRSLPPASGFAIIPKIYFEEIKDEKI